jgi:hypothetical protein
MQAYQSVTLSSAYCFVATVIANSPFEKYRPDPADQPLLAYQNRVAAARLCLSSSIDHLSDTPTLTRFWRNRRHRQTGSRCGHHLSAA